MEDYDRDASFTFGSFTDEDTEEFKRCYQQNGTKIGTPGGAPIADGGAVQKVARSPAISSSAPAVDKRIGGATAQDGGKETSRDTGHQQDEAKAVVSEGAALTEPPPAAAAAAPKLPRAQEMSWARIAASRPSAASTTVSAPTRAPISNAAGGLPARPPAASAHVSEVRAKVTPEEQASASRKETVSDTERQDLVSGDHGGERQAGATEREAPLLVERATADALDGATSGSSGKADSQEIADIGAAAAAGLSAVAADGVGKGKSPDVEAAIDAAAAEAARLSLEAEEEARVAEEADEKARRTWSAVVSMLGREDGIVAGEDARFLGGDAGPSVGDLVHRGLVNTGNSCFRSVVLQALLACDPFVRVVFRAAPGLRHCPQAQELLPTWAQFARFAAVFEPPMPGASPPMSAKRQGSGTEGGTGAWVTASGRGKGSRSHRNSAPEAVHPDEAMSRAFGAFRSANHGEQEDAQEFLAFFLDQLHEEIITAKRSQRSQGVDEGRGDGSSGGRSNSAAGTGVRNGARGAQAGENAWLEVGKGRSKAVLNTPDPQKRDSQSSVVTGLFYGMFRSDVKKGGSAKSSVTCEPFHCLQLDLDPPASSASSQPASQQANTERGPGSGIPNGFETANGAASRSGGAWGSHGERGQRSAGPSAVGNAWSGGGGTWGGAGGGPALAGSRPTVLEEALAALFGGEAVAGVKGRQNVEVKASRTLTLEQAPKVLTLHLKQFAFHPMLGPQKLARRVRYPLELTIPKKVMSPTLVGEISETGPLRYRLFTVVLHHGRSLHGGHYTALVRDPRGEWRHCDDQNVYPETEGHALNPRSGHPYLLLYSRT